MMAAIAIQWCREKEFYRWREELVGPSTEALMPTTICFDFVARLTA